MTKEELGSALRDAESALNNIVAQAERFVGDNILHGGPFGASGWNDKCGRKIGEAVVSSVDEAVKQNLDLYYCSSVLQKISEELSPLLAAIDVAKKELS